MARQAKILSFDEAKRTSSAPRPSVVAPKKPQKRRSAAAAAETARPPKGRGMAGSANSSDKKRSAKNAKNAKGVKSAKSARVQVGAKAKRSTLSQPAGTRTASNARTASSAHTASASSARTASDARAARGVRTAPDARSAVGYCKASNSCNASAVGVVPDSRSVSGLSSGPRTATGMRDVPVARALAAGRSAGRPAGTKSSSVKQRRGRYASDPRAERQDAARRAAPASSRDAEPEPEPARLSRLQKLKRERAKNKVDRTFSKQYGDQTSSAASSGPRAAVYKGEMGTTHRKAARMQNAGSGTDASAKRSGFGRGFASSPRFMVGVALAACLVLTGIFLYPSAKQYYVTMRECDRLQAEYEAIENRNANIQSEVDALATDAGVEDRAREEFGWVKTGEHAVNVRGLDVGEDESTFRANIVPGSVKAPETWYSKWLDPLFGVE